MSLFSCFLSVPLFPSSFLRVGGDELWRKKKRMASALGNPVEGGDAGKIGFKTWERWRGNKNAFYGRVRCPHPVSAAWHRSSSACWRGGRKRGVEGKCGYERRLRLWRIWATFCTSAGSADGKLLFCIRHVRLKVSGTTEAKKTKYVSSILKLRTAINTEYSGWFRTRCSPIEY